MLILQRNYVWNSARLCRAFNIMEIQLPMIVLPIARRDILEMLAPRCALTPVLRNTLEMSFQANVCKNALQGILEIQHRSSALLHVLQFISRTRLLPFAQLCVQMANLQNPSLRNVYQYII